MGYAIYYPVDYRRVLQMTTMSDIKLDRDEFNHALRSAVGVYFTTRGMSGIDLNLPTWIPVESLTHRKDDGKFIHLERVRFDFPLFDSGVSLRISMYIAYDKVWNVFYYLPRNEVAKEVHKKMREAHKKMRDDFLGKANDDNPPA